MPLINWPIFNLPIVFLWCLQPYQQHCIYFYGFVVCLYIGFLLRRSHSSCSSTHTHTCSELPHMLPRTHVSFRQLERNITGREETRKKHSATFNLPALKVRRRGNESTLVVSFTKKLSSISTKVPYCWLELLLIISLEIRQAIIVPETWEKSHLN